MIRIWALGREGLGKLKILTVAGGDCDAQVPRVADKTGFGVCGSEVAEQGLSWSASQRRARHEELQAPSPPGRQRIAHNASTTAQFGRLSDFLLCSSTECVPRGCFELCSFILLWTTSDGQPWPWNGESTKKIKKRKKSLKRTEKLERAQPSRRMMGRATVGAQDTVSRPCLLGDNEGQRSRCKYLHSPVAAQPLFIYRSASLNAPSAVFTALPLPRCAGCEGQPSTERAVARGSRQATCPPVAALPGGIGHR